MQAEWQARKAAGLYRQRHCVESVDGAEIQVDGQRYINFSSNDVLGFSQHPKVKQAARSAIDVWGVGSGASPMVTGYRAPHEALETAMAAWLGFERAVYVANGYIANTAVCKALLTQDHAVWIDRECHASLVDGVLASGAARKRYRRSQLQPALLPTASPAAIISDTVFSMSGDVAPLQRLVACAQSSDSALLILDDAHGLGVLGDQGRGTLCHAGVHPSDVTALVCPLGKAIGGYGAMVLGSSPVIETLLQQARGLIYSTALPPALAGAALASVQLLQEAPEHHARLHQHRQYLNAAIDAHAWPMAHSQTAIYFFPVGDVHRAMQCQQMAREAGLWCAAMRPPTVQVPGLRVMLSALHTQAHLDQLITFLNKVSG